VMRLADATDPGVERPVAVSVEMLEETPLFGFEVGGRSLLVVTSPGGANRVYEVGDVRMDGRSSDNVLVDSEGREWRVEADALVRVVDPLIRLERVVANRAFWFGWFAQFPDTLLLD